MENSHDFVLEAKNLKKSFSLEAGFFSRKDKKVYAVNDVSFGIERGKTYGLVGESGCGKTTTARILVRMYRADSGTVEYAPILGEKTEIGALKQKNLKKYHEEVKYVFQDPSRSLNPRMTVFSILTDALRYSSLWNGKSDAREKAGALIEEVGLSKEDLERRPSEFSGGQRQRISIARGLIMNPKVLVCDEVVSALDVSIQGQILNLLQTLREKRGLSFLFIAHDLRVSGWFCDKIGVMYSGVLLEEASARDLYKTAAHPYTRLLYEGNGGKGEVKTVLSAISGCPFASRCPDAQKKCTETLPPWTKIEEDHFVRCHLFCS